jgi:tRNA G18 (ribose-2'-O)-methylase SpoU
MLGVPITDLNDPRIAIYRSLKLTNQTRRLGQFVVEGEKLVERLLASRFPPVSILVTDRHAPRLLTQIPDDVPTYIVPDELVDSIVGFPFHRGVLACAQTRPWPPLEEIVRSAGPRLTLVVCPRLSNPENLGAIARIGDVFGIDAIVAGPSCPDPFSRRVLRVSMGSILRVPVIAAIKYQELVDTVDILVRDSGLVLIGAVADPAAEPFDAKPRPGRVGLVMGEEDRGIEPEWLERCGRIVTIPMRTDAGSLNVAVAAGILLHGLMRDQRHDEARAPG